MSRRGGPPPDISRMISLKVDGFSYRTSRDDIESLFEKYGRVGDVYIPKDHRTKENRGFGFVRYFHSRDAEDAIESLDGRRFDGRELSVTYARYDRPERNYYGGGGGSSRRRSRSRSRDRRRRSRSRSRSRDRRRSRSRSRDRRRRSRSRSSRSKSRSRDNDRSNGHRSRSRSRSGSRDDDRRRSGGSSKKRRDDDDESGHDSDRKRRDSGKSDRSDD